MVTSADRQAMPDLVWALRRGESGPVVQGRTRASLADAVRALSAPAPAGFAGPNPRGRRFSGSPPPTTQAPRWRSSRTSSSTWSSRYREGHRERTVRRRARGAHRAAQGRCRGACRGRRLHAEAVDGVDRLPRATRDAARPGRRRGRARTHVRPAGRRHLSLRPRLGRGAARDPPAHRHGIPRYDDLDVLVLTTGEQLVAIGGGEYRTEVDGFRRIVASRTVGRSPSPTARATSSGRAPRAASPIPTTRPACSNGSSRGGSTRTTTSSSTAGATTTSIPGHPRADRREGCTRTRSAGVTRGTAARSALRASSTTSPVRTPSDPTRRPPCSRGSPSAWRGAAARSSRSAGTSRRPARARSNSPPGSLPGRSTPLPSSRRARWSTPTPEYRSSAGAHGWGGGHHRGRAGNPARRRADRPRRRRGGAPRRRGRALRARRRADRRQHARPAAGRSCRWSARRRGRRSIPGAAAVRAPGRRAVPAAATGVRGREPPARRERAPRPHLRGDRDRGRDDRPGPRPADDVDAGVRDPGRLRRRAGRDPDAADPLRVHVPGPVQPVARHGHGVAARGAQRSRHDAHLVHRQRAGRRAADPQRPPLLRERRAGGRRRGRPGTGAGEQPAGGAVAQRHVAAGRERPRVRRPLDRELLLPQPRDQPDARGPRRARLGRLRGLQRGRAAPGAHPGRATRHTGDGPRRRREHRSAADRCRLRDVAQSGRPPLVAAAAPGPTPLLRRTRLAGREPRRSGRDHRRHERRRTRRPGAGVGAQGRVLGAGRRGVRVQAHDARCAADPGPSTRDDASSSTSPTTASPISCTSAPAASRSGSTRVAAGSRPNWSSTCRTRPSRVGCASPTTRTPSSRSTSPATA